MFQPAHPSTASSSIRIIPTHSSAHPTPTPQFYDHNSPSSFNANANSTAQSKRNATQRNKEQRTEQQNSNAKSNGDRRTPTTLWPRGSNNGQPPTANHQRRHHHCHVATSTDNDDDDDGGGGGDDDACFHCATSIHHADYQVLVPLRATSEQKQRRRRRDVRACVRSCLWWRRCMQVCGMMACMQHVH